MIEEFAKSDLVVIRNTFQKYFLSVQHTVSQM